MKLGTPLKRRMELPDECFTCPLDDCNDTSDECPVRRQKKAAQGKYVAEKTYVKRNIAPTEYKDLRDYNAQYGSRYWGVTGKKVIRGIKMLPSDIDFLQAHFRKQGQSLEGWLARSLEGLVAELRNQST